MSFIIVVSYPQQSHEFDTLEQANQAVEILKRNGFDVYLQAVNR